MKNVKKNEVLVRLKSALKNVTLGAVLAGGVFVPAAKAAVIDVPQQTLEQRVKLVSDALRLKLAEDNRSGSLEAKGDSDELLAQWGNAWGNWNNWRNWNNWYNWGNWGNWGNW